MAPRLQPSGVLADRADGGSSGPFVPTLVDVLRLRASTEPDRHAYTFLADGESDERHLTYAELDLRARAIAARLRADHAAGERILLLLPTGLEYVSAFFGCLYAGMIAVPAYPPRRNQSLDRIESMVADARPVAALATAASIPQLAALAAETPGFERLPWLAVDEIGDEIADHWQQPR